MQFYALITCLENVMQKEMPTHVLVAFDAGKTTFRTEFYSEYKAGRSKTPGEFKEQMPYIRELLTWFRCKIYVIKKILRPMISSERWRISLNKEEFDVVVLSGRS